MIYYGNGELPFELFVSVKDGSRRFILAEDGDKSTRNCLEFSETQTKQLLKNLTNILMESK